MKFLLGGLCLSLALAVSLALPVMMGLGNITHGDMSQQHPHHSIPGSPDRCDGLGFDAISLDEQGVTNFFRGEFVWKGFYGPADFINHTWPVLPSHIDAAFRLHHKASPEQHDRMFFFKGNQVWQYSGRLLEGVFLIHDKFPGIPDNIGSAVECPVGECTQDSVLFFKGETVYELNLNTKTVKERKWPGLHSCTASQRWLERHYCFQGTAFIRFKPNTGEVPPGYPKDARDYFMRCEGRGHGKSNRTSPDSIYNRCNNRTFDEFTEDQLGRIYAFRDNLYFRLDSARDGWHPWLINSSWSSLRGKIDGVFTWDKKMYFIQGSQLFIYKAEAQYTLVEGYPKPVGEELGIHNAVVDATFICPGSSVLYVILGNQVHTINLEKTPRVLENGFRIGHPHVDGAMCDTNGVYLFIGTKYYKYNSISDLTAWTSTPEPQSISRDFMHCAD